MAIAYASEGAISIVNPAATTNNVPYPATVNAGDLLVLFISTNGGAVTAPSGWTEIYRETTLSNPKGGLFIKVAAGTESGSQAVTTASTVSSAQMFRYTGVDTTTPQDAAATSTVNSASTTSAILPSITTATAGAMLIYVASPNSSTTQTSSTTGTERCDFGATTGGKGGGLFDEIVSGTGATGNRTITLSASRANWGAMLALRPAATSGSEASAALSGTGTLAGNNVTPNFIRTPDVSGSGTLAGVAVWNAPASFDDGTLQDWSATTAGSGTVQVVAGAAHDGAYGVRVSTPADTVDAASISKPLSPTTLKARIAGWWRVTTEGLSSTNVSFARFMDGTTILAGMYRQNVTAGPNVWLRTAKADGTGFYFTGTGFRMELGEWVYIEFEWNHSTGTPLVKINGTTYLNTAMADWFAASQMDSVVVGSPETGKSGVWELDTVRVNTYQAAAGLTGSGTLSSTITPGFPVSAPYSGTGTLSATTVSGSAASAALSGSGTLTSTVTAARSVSAALSGSGTLSSTRTPGATLTGNLSGSGSLTGEQTNVTMSLTPNLTGSGTLTRTAVANFTAGMSSSGTGTLTAAVTNVGQSAAPAFTGSGTLTGTQTNMSATRSAALSGAGTLTRVVTPAWAVNASLSGSGALTSEFSNSFNRSANLTGSGTLSGTATAARNVTGNLSGTGTLSGSAGGNKSASGNLTGAGTLQGFTTSAGMNQSAALSGSGTLSGSAYVTRLAQGPLSGSGSLTVSAVPNHTASGSFAGSGMMVVEYVPQRYVQANLSGSGTLGTAIDQTYNYTVRATLGSKRWTADVGLKRWKGSL